MSVSLNFHDQSPKISRYIFRVVVDLLLIGTGAIIFSLSFPSFASTWGWFPLAFISIIPVFIVVHRADWVAVFFYGLLYGYITFSLFNSWLANFHPLAGLVVPIIYAVWFLIVFPLLKAADSLFKKNGYLVQLAIWIGFEYIRTTGFLGYSYGVLGYSQYLFNPLLQAAALGGVFAVSALVAFPSIVLGNALKSGLKGFSQYILDRKFVLIGFVAAFVATIVYGLLVPHDFSDAKMWRVALVQQNVDPWKGGTNPYKQSLEICIRLSEEAEKENPDIVIWSETSFVPGIDWHTRYRTDHSRYVLVKRLLDFMAEREIPYVIGNDHGEKRSSIGGSLERIDYNATLLFEDGELETLYRKINLVPFTENFPFQDQFPKLYDLVMSFDVHPWEAGEELTVFDANGVKFSTPICFEDTFGYLSRAFVREGAQVIVNLTNDSWSKSVVAEMQHMAMAVFRAVENRRTMVRSTNGGITCTILPDGRISAMLEPFVQDYLIDDVPIYDDTETLYTKAGDYVGIGSAILACMLLLVGIAVRVIAKRPWAK